MNFHSLSLTKLASWCSQSGEKPFRAKQVWDWVYKKNTLDFGVMSNLSETLRSRLKKCFSQSSLILETKEVSQTEDTIKYLWRLSDDKLVESVLILAPGRKTICVSSQVGCPAKCAFCASGKEGFFRNLTKEEIFEQVYKIQQDISGPVTNIVFMGMGEPLENYDQVIEALRLLTDKERLNFSERKITVSTVGVVEGIEKFTEEKIKVNLVLSLHAPNQHVRKKIIPYARKYDLDQVLSAIRKYTALTRRDTTYEYILIDGINDDTQHAVELAELVKNDACSVNLIPYNPVEGLALSRPSKEKVIAFKNVLMQKGIVTTWRYTKGKDIAAACGQLALKKKPSNSQLAVLPG